MTSYLDRASESSFVDLSDDDEFKKDLVQFFSGGRYQYTVDEMEEMGIDGLANQFVEHMRYQSANEVSAAKDYSYVMNKDFDDRGKQAFGRLMQAYDNSESAGTGFWNGVGDYSEAIFTAPSTYIGLGSFGLGKLGAKAASKATQMLLRKELKDRLAKNVVDKGIKRNVYNAAKKEAITGAVTGATIGGGQAALQGETREEVIDDYDYTTKDFVFDATVGGATEAVAGGALGYLSGVIGRKTDIQVNDALQERGRVISEELSKKAQIALETLNNASAEQKKAAFSRVADLDEVLSARAGSKSARLKDKLDPERVAKGSAILRGITNDSFDPEFTSGLSANTMRRIAAASIELMQESRLNIKDNERITESVAFAMRDPATAAEVFPILEKVRNKYGLSKDEFSMIYLSEVSRAGQTLGYASAIKRGANLAGMDDLFSKGASSFTSEEATLISANAMKNAGRGTSFLQDLDAMRIAFMTSQPATTMRNLRNSGILIGTDMLDEVNRALYKGLTGDPKAIRDVIPNMTSVLKGFTLNKAEGKILRNIMLDEAPEQYRNLFNDAARIDVGIGSNNAMGKVARTVNLFNSATDSVLKEAMFFGSLDRQFRKLGGQSLREWIKSNQTLDLLPEGISIEQAIDDAQRLTMQRTFRESDATLAKGTKKLVELNRKLPFIISEGLGVPFPRYVGNHLQMVGEYTPIIGELLQRSNIITSADPETRMARQMTGAMLILGGYQVAQMRGGEVDYGSFKTELGAQEDMKPYAGHILAHLYAGDMAWRIKNGLPVKFTTDEIQDIFGGIPDLTFDFAIGAGILEAMGIDPKTGSKVEASTERLEKEIGSIASTFTMPLTISRDVYSQFDNRSAGSPFIRDLALESRLAPRKGEGLFSEGVLTAQTTRMLPDTPFIQYTQSFDGSYDMPYYKITNPVRIGSVDPLLKQITGATAEPPLTSLEKEMNKYNLKDWKIYNTRTVPNASLDFALRAHLSQNLYKNFNDWANNAPAMNNSDKTFYELTEEDKPGEILEAWIKREVNVAKTELEQQFNQFAARKPAMARGYIRNAYKLKRSELGADVFNQVVKDFVPDFESSREYLQDAETVQEEINRRMFILTKVNNYVEPKLRD